MENEIVINNVEYVRKDSIIMSNEKHIVNGLQYVIIRTQSAGVFSGYLQRRDGKEVELLKARRFFQWYGSSTLSQFAQSGTSKPEKCKFPEEVDSIILTEAIEIIPCSKKAERCIKGVKVWKA